VVTAVYKFGLRLLQTKRLTNGDQWEERHGVIRH